MVRGSRAAMSAAVCWFAAASCVLIVAGGCLAAGHDGALFIPLGGLGSGPLAGYWLAAVIWFVGAVFAAMQGRWLPVLGSAVLVALTLLPSALIFGGCLRGGCI